MWTAALCETSRPIRWCSTVAIWLSPATSFPIRSSNANVRPDCRAAWVGGRSSLILMNTASGASAWNADITYNSPFVAYDPTNLNNGEAIALAAQPSVDAIEKRIFNAWEALRQGKGE